MKRILFPVDFSPQCDALAPAVAALAAQFNARLSLLHVLSAASRENQPHFATLAEEIQGTLANYHRALFQPLHPDRIFKIGDPAEEIVAHARHTLTELILMPTHGRSRFRQLLLGSVTAKVLHDSNSAVLTSAHAARLSHWTRPSAILCAIDLSPFAADVLDMADHFALHCRCPLRVVHAVPGELTGDLDLRVEDALDRYPALAAAAEVKQPLHIITGASVNAAILDEVQRTGADLLVVGRGQLQGVLGRLRSGVHDLVRRAPCPVLSV